MNRNIEHLLRPQKQYSNKFLNQFFKKLKTIKPLINSKSRTGLIIN